jgi:hypothetical protein
VAVSEERRRALRAAALVGLIRSVDGDRVDATRVVSAGPVAAGLIRDDRADVLVASGAPAVVAGAILWADRQGASRVRLIVDEPDRSAVPTDGSSAAVPSAGSSAVVPSAGSSAVDARRWASRFAVPTEVFAREGADAVPVDAERGDAERVGDPPAEPTVDDPTLRTLLSAAGLEVVEEHGVVTGELLGLEVARLVVWPESSGGDGLVHVETGVGRFDRDATAAVRADEPPDAALRRVVAQVGAHRRVEDPTHPLSLLARERWLRRSIVDDPRPLGLVDLEPIATTAPRGGVRDPAPAAARGRDRNGDPVVVVCSVGADLAFVPVAADTRAAVDPDAALVLVVPERDLLASTRRLAELVVGGAELVGVLPPWGAVDGESQ